MTKNEFDPKPDSPLTEAEWNVYSLLSKAFNVFIELPEKHVMDRQEFATAINALKYIVMSRLVARECQIYSLGGYLLGDEESTDDD